MVTFPEPRVTLKMEGDLVDFLVDTGAEHSVHTELKGQMSQQTRWVQKQQGIKLINGQLTEN